MFSPSLSVAEPNFVSMAQMPESFMSEDGDDDKVYLFFSETAVECDCYNKLVVSRVARVCKVRKTSFPLFVSVSPERRQYFPFPTRDSASRRLSPCAHRAISEVRGPCRRNGRPS